MPLPRARVEPAPAGDHLVAETALASRAFWKAVCGTVAEFVFETDRAGRLVFVSPAQVLGHDADGLIGRSAARCFDAVIARGSAPPDPFDVRAPIRMHPVELARADGSRASYAISARPTAQGGTLGIGIALPAPAPAPADPAEAGDPRLRRILGAMREELVPARAVDAALAALLAETGAEGSAIVELDPATPPASEAAAAIAALHLAGTGWEQLSAFVARQLRAEDDAPCGGCGCAPGAADARWSRGGGRTLLLSPTRTRIGPVNALLLWRAGDAGWEPGIGALVSALAAALRTPLETSELQHEMARNGRTDPVTGLLNRHAFAGEVNRRLERLERDAAHATVMSIELDGEDAADGEDPDRDAALLRHAAAVLREAVRPTDLVARLGGHGFAIWLDGADSFAAAERAETMCRDGVQVQSGAGTRRIGLSIGLAARCPTGDESFDSLLRRAAAAMTHAKRSGPGAWRASRQEIET